MQNGTTLLTAPAPKPKHTAKKRKEAIFLFCMLALPVIQWLVFWLYVNFSSIMLAFKDQRTGDFTFTNFINFWDSLTSPLGEINLALRNTLIYFCTSLFVIMPTALLISYFLYKRVIFFFRFI